MVPLALVRYSSVLGEFRVQTPGTRYSESVLSTGYTEVGYLLASALSMPDYIWLSWFQTLKLRVTTWIINQRRSTWQTLIARRSASKLRFHPPRLQDLSLEIEESFC